MIPKASIGIIGGSGLYGMEDLEDVEAVAVETPFGKPSANFVFGKLEGISVVFLSRHGLGHTLLPSEINYRANIFAMKKIGVERIISVSAVGSMKEEIAPGHIVIPDQFYDLTKKRDSTFFGNGIVAHVSFAQPICSDLLDTAAQTGTEIGGIIHRGGIYLCMEGPQFSTRAESHVHRSWGVDVIGMTNATEAKLAREAEMCYVTIALSTDYDCWRVEEKPVTAEMVLKKLSENIVFSKKIIRAIVPKLSREKSCGCASSLQNAIVTSPKLIPPELREALNPLIGKYLS